MSRIMPSGLSTVNEVDLIGARKVMLSESHSFNPFNEIMIRRVTAFFHII